MIAGLLLTGAGAASAAFPQTASNEIVVNTAVKPDPAKVARRGADDRGRDDHGGKGRGSDDRGKDNRGGKGRGTDDGANHG